MKADAVQDYLRHPRKRVHAKLVSYTRKKEIVVVRMLVDVNLPQRPVFDIKKTEVVEVLFPADDGMPQVFVLRKSFPRVPHLMLRQQEFPRQLCLYELPWEMERANWSARGFIERIRLWLKGTADGTLHPADQPLEPIMFPSPLRLVLPEPKATAGEFCWVEKLHLYRTGQEYILAYRQPPQSNQPPALPVLFVRTPPAEHGLIYSSPSTLAELEKLLAKFGGSLVKTIAAELPSIRAELKNMAGLPLILVVELPKRRYRGGPIADTERQAFIIGEGAEALREKSVQVNKGGIWVPEVRLAIEDPVQLQKVKLVPVGVRRFLEPKFAATLNGYEREDTAVVAIGAGALGSQVMNNLWRGGFGSWTIVDDDFIEPHNPARHLLDSRAVGFRKAEVVPIALSEVFPGHAPPVGVVANYLEVKNPNPKLAAALKAAKLVFDFSASVQVQRRLALDGITQARRASAFLNQRGDESIVLVEDTGRKTNLGWLEAEYMRAVAFDSRLTRHFDDATQVAHRYGNGCRELSSTVPQDGVGIHAGLVSAELRRSLRSSEARVLVRRWSRETGAVTAVPVLISTPQVTQVREWTIMLHPSVIEEIGKLRTANLPNETGGVLLGIVDRTHKYIAVVGFLPAPPDSEAWPTSFIRGSNGLAEQIRKVSKRTLGNVIYVGEWHSHPAGHNANPSVDDVKAVAICSIDMKVDALPTLMVIVAETEIGTVLMPPDESTISVEKFPYNPVQP